LEGPSSSKTFHDFGYRPKRTGIPKDFSIIYVSDLKTARVTRAQISQQDQAEQLEIGAEVVVQSEAGEQHSAVIIHSEAGEFF
jgi:hypothetical protein